MTRWVFYFIISHIGTPQLQISKGMGIRVISSNKYSARWYFLCDVFVFIVTTYCSHELFELSRWLFFLYFQCGTVAQSLENISSMYLYVIVCSNSLCGCWIGSSNGLRRRLFQLDLSNRRWFSFYPRTSTGNRHGSRFLCRLSWR